MRSRPLHSINILWRLSAGLCLASCTPSVISLGTDRVPATLTQQTFITPDNTRLGVRRWLPKNRPPRAIVIALHGFNDYSNFFAQSGQQLQQQGIASFSYDQRGFGGALQPGIWPGSLTLVQDLKDFIALIKHHYPKPPIYLLGSSMGGAVIILTMTQTEPPEVEGIILAAPAVWAKRTMPWYQRWALCLTRYTLPWLKLSGKGLNIRPSDNLAMLKKINADPLVIKKTRIDAMHGLTNLMSLALKRSEKLHTSALIMFGERDEIIPQKPVAEMLQKLPEIAKDKQKIALYRQGFHMLLRDLNADVVHQDIISWINNPQQGLPSGADKRSLNLLRQETNH